MKKALIFFLFSSAFSFNLTAQKGTVLIGGDLTYAHQSRPSGTSGNSNNTENALLFNFLGGFQFTENITAGVVVGVGSANSKSGEYEDKDNLFSAGPFIRCTKKISDLFAVYGQFQATFGSNKSTSKSPFGSSESKSSFTEVSIFPALFVNIRKGFGLNFTIGGLAYNTSKPEGGSSTNTFAFTFGKSVSIGVSKNF